MTGFNLGDRVLILEPHPAAGYKGEVVAFKPIAAPEGYDEDGWIVKLDVPLVDTGRVVAYNDQIKHLTGGAS